MESLHWSESKPILYCYVREVEKTSSIWIQNSKTRSHGQSDRNRLENGFWITAYEFCRILLHSPLCMALKILLKIFVFWISSRIACDYQSGVKSIWSVFICYFYLKILYNWYFLFQRYTMLAKCSSLIIWGGSIAFGLLLAIIMTNLIWQRSQSKPTLTTVDTYYHPIWNVPFPAITVCNINLVYRSTVEKFSKHLYEMIFYSIARGHIQN